VYFQVVFIIFWQKDIAEKADHKMLMKEIPDLVYLL